MPEQPDVNLPEGVTQGPAPLPQPGGASRWGRLEGRVVEVARGLAPGSRAWRGASYGLIAVAIAVWVIPAWETLATPSPNLAGLIPLIVVAVVAVLAGGLIVLLLALLASPPRLYRWTLASVCCLLLLLVMGVAPLGLVVLLLATVTATSLAGAGLLVLACGGVRDATRLQRGVAWAGLLLGGAAITAGLVWMLRDGFAEKPVPDAARVVTASARPMPLALPDPSQPGPHRVRTLTYGSGADRHRPEFGARADLRTKSVDGSPFIERWSGAAGWARTRYWGFEAARLPLQGRVWYPEGEGPFPLVLVVHGNHQAEDFSDPGYRYLGELMASRGMILVSVDENFLNSSVTDLLGFPDVGLKEENDARGWLLLEHLKVWRGWNATGGHPFFHKVDLDRVALIGHSRGGEAVAVAAAFNRLPFYPDDARVRFEYGFSIRAVIAIAPVDGQYKPAGTGTRLDDVSYFVLHGSHDADMASFHGSRVYHRVRFTGGDHFKAGLYIHRANHGQFNATWGRRDAWGLYNTFLNLRPLLSEADQEKIARVYISAFLEATLLDRRDYRPLFRDHRVAPGWLPDIVYLHEYEDSSTRLVATFDEDIDVTTTTLAGGRIEGTNLADWKEREIQIKWGSLDTRAVVLGWDKETAGGRPSYAITLPAEGLSPRPESTLTFHLADAKQEPSKPLGAKDESKGKEAAKARKEEPKQPIDLTVEVADRGGAVSRLPLSHFSALQPQIEARVVKAGVLTETPTSEVVFQVFDFPLTAFSAANPAFNPSTLTTVRLIFDRTEKGVVILDDVGLR
jgi:dienelactone hydrolase